MSTYRRPRGRGGGGPGAAGSGSGGGRAECADPDVRVPSIPPEAASASSIGVRGYGIPKRLLPESVQSRLRRDLTVRPRAPPVGPQPPPYPVYLESVSKIYVPRYLGVAAYGAPPEDRRPPPEARPGLAFAGSLRASQDEPVQAFLAAARDPGRMGGVLNMGCASGKTVMALYAACALGLKTLVVVHKQFLLNQWEERISQFVPGAAVGRIQGPVDTSAGADIVIGMLQSLATRDYGPSLSSGGFGLLIVDECHHTSAEVFSRALARTSFRHSMGLSATIARKDGLGHVFRWFLGPVVYKSKREAQAGVEVLRLVAPRAPPGGGGGGGYGSEHFSAGGSLNIARMMTDACKCSRRSELIARTVAEFAAVPGRRILVLSERRGPLEELDRMIRSGSGGGVGGGAPATSGFYVGGMKEADLKESLECQVILATYSMASEGFDHPCLNTLVLATSRTDIEQSVGRILRQRPEAREHSPVVVDVVDDFSVFRNQAAKRAKFYSRHGFSSRSAAQAAAPARLRGPD